MIKIKLDKIRSEMNKRDITRTELRKRIQDEYYYEMSRQNICNFFNGRSKSFKTAYHICEVLQLDINKVLSYE